MPACHVPTYVMNAHPTHTRAQRKELHTPPNLLTAPPATAGRLVYDPSIRVARNPTRRTLALMGSFVMSGLCHQMMFL